MIIMIDNYDSFTFNLVQYLSVLGEEIIVYRNDQITVEDVLKQKPKAIVISPGPCDPDKAGICLDLIAAASEKNIPLLGICLGHQAIGQAFGGKIIRAPQPMHGKTDKIKHQQTDIFQALPSPYIITRYHSLIVERESLPQDLEITAENDDGIIMALRHKIKPIYGVQFHPESIASEHGHALLKNFVDIANGS